MIDVEYLNGHRGVGAVRAGAYVVKRVSRADFVHGCQLEPAADDSVRIPPVLAHTFHRDSDAVDTVRAYVTGRIASKSLFLLDVVDRLCRWIEGNARYARASGCCARLQPSDEMRFKTHAIVDSVRTSDVFTAAQKAVVVASCDTFNARFTSSSRMLPELVVGIAHGDLTLENVIVDVHGNPHLIDAHVPLAMSPTVDLAKLRQCTRHGWSLRDQPEPLPAVMRQADERVLESAARLSLGGSAFDAQEWLGILRIVPHAKSPQTAAWICRALEEYS